MNCEDKLLIRPVDVAKMLGLGRSKVYEMLAKGELPVVRIGTSVRVSCEALVEWVRSQTKQVA